MNSNSTTQLYKKILVLGSEGQIGNYLCAYLTSRNYSIEHFDITRDAQSEDLRVYKNPHLIEKINNCDFVFFLAFDVGGSLYMKKYQDTFGFIDNNIKIMNTVFSSLKDHKKPFIYISSQMANMLHSTYGILKLIGDRYTQSLGGLTVKLWNVYGVEADMEKSHVITDFILMAKNKGSIKMKTNGQEERQFLHAEDCSKALEVLMNRYSDIDKTEDTPLTSFKWASIYEIATIISKQFNNCPIHKSDAIDSIQGNIKNDPDSKILTFWKPEHTLESGILNVIESIGCN
jgi:nucleoside-diphosphate-sugar epimerase